MTAPEENLKPADFPKSFHLLTSTTLRANTYERLIQNHDKISFEQARAIREDVSFDKENINFRHCQNCNLIPEILATHPRLKGPKKVYDKWNGSFDVDNEQATYLSVAVHKLSKYIRKELGSIDKDIPCLLYTSPSPRDATLSRMPSSA